MIPPPRGALEPNRHPRERTVVIKVANRLDTHVQGRGRLDVADGRFAIANAGQDEAPDAQVAAEPVARS